MDEEGYEEMIVYSSVGTLDSRRFRQRTYAKSMVHDPALFLGLFFYHNPLIEWPMLPGYL